MCMYVYINRYCSSRDYYAQLNFTLHVFVLHILLYEQNSNMHSSFLSKKNIKFCLCFPGKWLACQSMDNQIVIFNVLNRFKYMRKKVFKGHMVSMLKPIYHSIKKR